MFFAKIPRGVKDFRKNGRGGGVPPISGLIMFLLTSVLKFAWGGYIYPLPSPHLTPPCVHLWPNQFITNLFLKLIANLFLKLIANLFLKLIANMTEADFAQTIQLQATDTYLG